jgi:hypothetical protein
MPEGRLVTGPRHRLKIVSPTVDPAHAVVTLDGKQLDFVSRIELVLDADTSEATVRLSVPAHFLDIDVDAQVFVTAHALEAAAASEPPTAAPCTASLRDVTDNVRRCIQAASHYDETREPVWATPLGPPDPGGLHTDGDAVWYDHAPGATPHGAQADG